MTNTKTCTKCGQIKPLSEFHKHSASKDGYKSACKECRNLDNVHYRKANPDKNQGARKWQLENYERHLENQRKWRESNPDYYSNWRDENKDYEQARDTAKRMKRLNAKTEPYYLSDVLNTYGIDCYLCHLPIDLSAPRKSGIPGWQMGLHIDHVVSIKNGGIDNLDNVRPSHGQCNLRKNAKSLDEYLKR